MQVPIFVELETYRTLLEYQGAKMWDIKSWTERAKKSWMAFWLEKLAALVTVVGIGFAVYSLIAIQEERKIWYWTLLTTPAPGNSGKIEALEYLAKQGVSLTSIDLSCRAMRGEETVTKSNGSKKTKCERPVYLEGLDLSKKTLKKKADLSGANLSGANLRDANLSGANLDDVDLSDANLSDANLRDANLSGANLDDAKLFDAKLFDANLSGADLFNAKLSRAKLSRARLNNAKLIYARLNNVDLSDANLRRANLSDANLRRASLSDADFKNTIFSSDTTFTNAWAWADKPPRNLPATIQIQLCKYNKEGSNRNRRNRRPDPCIPPDTR